jgi:hypothetical protein
VTSAQPSLAGLVAIVAFVALGWIWPDGVRLWLSPIYRVWPFWSAGPLPHIYMFVGDMACFLPVQLLLASCGGLLARFWLGRRGRTVPPDRSSQWAGW